MTEMKGLQKQSGSEKRKKIIREKNHQQQNRMVGSASIAIRAAIIIYSLQLKQA